MQYLCESNYARIGVANKTQGFEIIPAKDGGFPTLISTAQADGRSGPVIEIAGGAAANVTKVATGDQ